ncbi:PepSY domain-containing protein [Paucisalibacillus globulus]|uniref:PepSY domain-containing protein n=1 Tax=Paucisalibacillus globulus TaxID=351095 RepID=UPI00041B4B87|nr:PepSY domain-containing protein [Paucisalibacillus globulus]
MKTESSKTPWIIVLVLSVILVVGLILNQPMSEDEAIEIAKELVPEEFDEVYSTQFTPMNETEIGADIWIIQLENKEEDRALLTINANNGKMIEGKIEDGETGEVLENL